MYYTITTMPDSLKARCCEITKEDYDEFVTKYGGTNTEGKNADKYVDMWKTEKEMKKYMKDIREGNY